MQINFERAKTYTLLLLVIMSLILVGILWEYQSPWFPTSFLSESFAPGKPDPQIIETEAKKIIETAAKKDYFSPERIVYSLGFDSGYRVITKDSIDYQTLWNSSKNYISLILSPNNTDLEPQKLMPESWSEIVNNQLFVIEFKTPIDRELLAWSLQLQYPVASSCPVNNIYKIAVSPNESYNYDMHTVYVLTDNLVYKYNIKITQQLSKAGVMSKDEYIETFKKIESNVDFNEYMPMKWTQGKTPKFKVRSDMIIPWGSKEDSVKYINSIKSIRPDFLSKNQNAVADEILKNEKDSYDFDVFKDVNVIEFRNYNNIYRINPDGILEYRYLSDGKDEGKGSIVSAFQNTVQFIEGIKHLIPGTELSLTNITRDDNDQSYKFEFDYKINGMKSFVNYELQGYEDKLLNHSLVIKANSNRVTYCLWLLRRFENSEEKPYYATITDNVINNLAEKLGNDYNNNFLLNDIDVCYDIGPRSELKVPVWLATINDKKSITIEMEQEK